MRPRGYVALALALVPFLFQCELELTGVREQGEACTRDAECKEPFVCIAGQCNTIVDGGIDTALDAELDSDTSGDTSDIDPSSDGAPAADTSSDVIEDT